MCCILLLAASSCCFSAWGAHLYQPVPSLQGRVWGSVGLGTLCHHRSPAHGPPHSVCLELLWWLPSFPSYPSYPRFPAPPIPDAPSPSALPADLDVPGCHSTNPTTTMTTTKIATSTITATTTTHQGPCAGHHEARDGPSSRVPCVPQHPACSQSPSHLVQRILLRAAHACLCVCVCLSVCMSVCVSVCTVCVCAVCVYA